MILLKTLLWLLCLTPLGFLVYRGFTGGLGANPAEYLSHRTGFWTLTLIMVTLAITPLRRFTGWNQLIQFRRPIGLFAFFYACLHVTTYIVFDQFFDFGAMIEDIRKRPYITVGFTAFVLLIPLAITSTKGWIRRLGRRWTKLHRLIYVTAILGVLHFFWKEASKADVRDPLIFAGVLAVLLLARSRLRPRVRRDA
ncbi:MAG: protein-methionine-sulfoxide reductase heme-binding subunit MsrQ [Gemmatimonadota bacterium]